MTLAPRSSQHQHKPIRITCPWAHGHHMTTDRRRDRHLTAPELKYRTSQPPAQAPTNERGQCRNRYK